MVATPTMASFAFNARLFHTGEHRFNVGPIGRHVGFEVLSVGTLSRARAGLGLRSLVVSDGCHVGRLNSDRDLVAGEVLTFESMRTR